MIKCIREDMAASWIMGLKQPVSGPLPNAPSSNKYKRVSRPEPSVKGLDFGMKAAKNVGINPSAGEVELTFPVLLKL